MRAWSSVQTASIRFADLQVSSTLSGGKDGISLVTMADTPANRIILGGEGNPVALTKLEYEVSTGRIVEADIILNWKEVFSTNLANQSYDLQSVFTHELGHLLGCDHAVTPSDTMYFLTRPKDFFQRYLSPDAISFASFTYPDPVRALAMGEISGRVRSGGKPVFGAAITAVDVDRNLVYSGISERDGSYSIRGPIPGRYALFAEPLDGPATVQDLQLALYYKDANTKFRTVFQDDEEMEEGSCDEFVLKELNNEHDFELSSMEPTLNIDGLARRDPITERAELEPRAVVANPGESFDLFIGGSRIWEVRRVEDVRILGKGVRVVAESGIRLIRNDSDVARGISVTVRVAPDASPGPRTVVVRVGDEQAAVAGGLLIFQRGLPAITLYMPYLVASPEQYTGLALANTSSVPASVRISSRDSKGALIYDQDALVPANLAIAGGAQTASLERQLFNLPEWTHQAGSITLESDTREVQGFFLSGDLNSTYLDGAEAYTRAYGEFFFTDVIQNFRTTTEIHVMNVLDSAVGVDLTLVGSGGQILQGPVHRTIPGRGKIGEPVSDLFSYPGELSSAHVRVVAGVEALAGFGLVRQQDTVFGMNAFPPEKAASILYSPHLAVGNFGVNYSTRLNIVNVGASTSSVQVLLLGDNGQGLPGARMDSPFSLPPGGQRSIDVGSWYGIAGRFGVQGSIRVEGSDGSKLLANILFGDGDPTRTQLGFGAALPLSMVESTTSSKFIFSQVAQSQGFYTGVAFLAPVGAEVRIEVFGRNGLVTGSNSLNLTPGQRSVWLLRDLVPSTAGQTGGYVKVTSSNPVIAFELFGAVNGKFLSAVPPQRLLN
jgi:hypothetical protein